MLPCLVVMPDSGPQLRDLSPPGSSGGPAHVATRPPHFGGNSQRHRSPPARGSDGYRPGRGRRPGRTPRPGTARRCRGQPVRGWPEPAGPKVPPHPGALSLLRQPVLSDTDRVGWGFARRDAKAASRIARRAGWPGPPALTERACCCPAKPVVRVLIPPASGRRHPTDLLLCGHHYRTSRAALAAIGAAVIDQTGAVVDPVPTNPESGAATPANTVPHR
jgi:hypothetical protein